MFEYDRLSLDVKQQITAAKNQKEIVAKEEKENKDTLSNGSSESQLFGWESPSPPAQDEDNSIVNGLSELLRRRSSPGHKNFAQQQHCIGDDPFHRNRSATISNGNEQFYSNMISSNLHQQTTPRHRTIGNALSMDLSEQSANRRFSGSSIHFSEIFDCGASSGYGSPGAVGTPLASPAAANSTIQFIANQLQKMLVDQGYCEGIPPVKTSNTKAVGIPATPTPVPVLPPSTPHSGLSTPSALTAIPIAAATPILVKATTTTSGTNKNSNKRKTSIANSGSSPVPENIVATEDGFANDEIEEFAELLSSPKRMPPSRYICHICYQQGHYISDCPQRFNSPYEELTPYQGRKKCYGEFQCEMCKRKWTSQNSVANEAQSCIKCHVPVFPHKQLPVDKAVALGLVKLQRLPVTPVTPLTPTPVMPIVGDDNNSQNSSLPAQQANIRNAIAIEDDASIYLELKKSPMTKISTSMSQIAI